MGAPKQKWSSEEEEALRAGVAKHGTGKWKNIQKDPEFVNCLANRSNIDLKDKWRNMSVSASGQGCRDKIKTPKPKALLPPPSSNLGTPSPLPAAQDASANRDIVPYSSIKSPSVVKNRDGNYNYTSMVIDALASMKDPNGSDADSIMGFIEQKYDVTFKGNLGQKLNRLASQDRIEKVQGKSGYFRVKEEGALGKKASTSAQMPKDDHHNQKHSEQTPTVIDSLATEIEEAAKDAAYRVADAENKAFLASKAVEEAEKVAKEAVESDSMLQLAIEIFQRCSRGEIVLMA
ncbi:hypothetical protein ACHQM5_001761 [Ranunculus cassubicifolius]